jgi:NAD(P)H-hydrate epimerase
MKRDYIAQLVMPETDSHKGQNGKLLIIGGSELFHAPLLWAAEVASRVVDMVHVTSPYLLNQKLMEQKLKEKFWNGIVVPWENVEEYIKEDEVVLIGPGMTRTTDTAEVTNRMIRQYPGKKWVVDGGALQMVDISLLGDNMVITPHQREWSRLEGKVPQELVVLLKGVVDVVYGLKEKMEIEGGNPGMTKGGTGDVLAGLVAALATKNDLMTAAVVASMVNKRAGERLFERMGGFFNATDLMQEIPHAMHEIIQRKY